MRFYRALAIRLGRWLRGTPAAPAATPEQGKLDWAHGLLATAVGETRAGRALHAPCDWTRPDAYRRNSSAGSAGIAGDFDDFLGRLRAMSDEDVAMAYRFAGGEGPRAEIIAAEMRRRIGRS